jgi:hypothetical protein
MEASAAIGNVLRVDFTAMRFHDRANNCESHSQTMLLGGKELVEQAFVHFRANARAMIAHTQAHFAVAIAIRANFYLALSGGVCRMASRALLTRFTRTC